MNTAGNTDGEYSKKVDPLQIVMLNLLANKARKHPGILARGINTMASYKLNREKDNFIIPGDIVYTPEITSTSAKAGIDAEKISLAASFGSAANYLNGPADKQILMHFNALTGVNIAHIGKLPQAEVLLPPGGLFFVRNVKTKNPSNVADNYTVDDSETVVVGHEVFLEQIDTAQLFTLYDDYQKYKAIQIN